MNLHKSEKIKAQPINWLLVGISLLVLGGLSMIFITQMELQPGWFWDDLQGTYSIDLKGFETDDINGDGKGDIITYADVDRRENPDEILYDTPQYGAIVALDGLKGSVLWNKSFQGPVKKVFAIPDLDGDMIQDYFINVAKVNESWYFDSYNGGGDWIPYIFIDQFTNKIISGKNGSELIYGPSEDFPKTGFIDLLSFDNFEDTDEDLICLEFFNSSIEGLNNYDVNITSYFINGTQKRNYYMNSEYSLHSFYVQNNFPRLESFFHDGEEHIMYIDHAKYALLNRTTLDPFNPIYGSLIANYQQDILDFRIIKDQNEDGTDEFLIFTKYYETDGLNLSIYDGIDGSFRASYNITNDDDFDYHEATINELTYAEANNKTYIIILLRGYKEPRTNKIKAFVQEIDSYNFIGEYIWEYEEIFSDGEAKIFPLNEDLDDDSLGEIVLMKPHYPLLSPNDVTRYYIINPVTKKNLAIINTDQWADKWQTMEDFDGDGENDLLIFSWQSIMTLSSQDPTPIFLSNIFPLGIPVFIILIAMLLIGLYLVIRNSKKLKVRRGEVLQNLKKRKLAVIVNIVIISLMTLTFLLFLLQINIFNQTLITGHYMTQISTVYLTTTIIWYTLLPLTAAIYNYFAPNFAYFFIKLRDLSFRVSKRYYNDIIVLDMEGRDELGLLLKLKRILLPLLLSIAIGFYTYNTLAPFLGYPTGFDQFATERFFNFIVGFNLLCILPMILTYIVFSFFISGNFLLDDTGIVYFRQAKNHRQPADIEPISIWAQNIIKGVAGISAIITFIQFFSTVDFSGFFQGEVMNIVFGFFMTLVFFWGIPFLTGFSYVLLAEEIMESSLKMNAEKLYSIMEKNEYNTKPQKITNLQIPELKITSENK